MLLNRRALDTNHRMAADNTLMNPKQNGRHFADDILICIYFDENLCILVQISLKYVPEDPHG